MQWVVGYSAADCHRVLARPLVDEPECMLVSHGSALCPAVVQLRGLMVAVSMLVVAARTD